MDLYPGNKRAIARLNAVRESFVKDAKVSNTGKTTDLKDVECFKCHKKGRYTNKCPNAKAKEGKGCFKGISKPSSDKKDEK